MLNPAPTSIGRELFYRFLVTSNLALTPDIQLVTNPALDPRPEAHLAFSMRTRLTF